MAIKEQLDKIREEALSAINAADLESAVEELRVKYLGKKGELTAILKQMGSLPAEERPLMGQLSNDVRKDIEALIAERSAVLKQHAQALRFKA